MFETVSDYQKTVFRNNPANKGRFITNGIMEYFPTTLTISGKLSSGLEYSSLLPPTLLIPGLFFSILCPIGTALQISFFSGIPLLEKAGLERWGGEEEYASYLENVAVLVPWMRCCECYHVPETEPIAAEADGYKSTDAEEAGLVDVKD